MTVDLTHNADIIIIIIICLQFINVQNAFELLLLSLSLRLLFLLFKILHLSHSKCVDNNVQLLFCSSSTLLFCSSST